MRPIFALLIITAATVSLHCTSSIAQDASTARQTNRPSRIRESAGAAAASLTTRIEPQYPEEAKRRGIEGQVVLHAIIGADGTVKELSVVSGPQELTQSALEAVKQWRYKQSLLNGQPLEVETTVMIDFSLESVSASRAAPPNGAHNADTRSVEPAPCAQSSERYSEVQCLEDLAHVYEDQKKYDDAEAVLKRALNAREKALGPDNPDVAGSSQRLGYSLMQAGRYAEAEPYLKRAVGIREKALGPESRELSQSLQLLGEDYSAEGKYSDAERIDARALAIRKKILPPDAPAYPEVAESMDALGVVYLAEARPADAQALLEQALKIRESSLQPDHPYLGFSLDHLARAYARQAKYAEAELSLKRALAISTTHADSALTVIVMLDYADLMQATSRTAEANDMRARAQGIREKLLKR